MATGRNSAGVAGQPAGAAPRPGRRRRLFTLVTLVTLAVLALGWGRINAYAEAGAAYGARVACSCRFVAGRELSQCRDDFLSGMGLVFLSENAAEQSVTARLVPLASETARYYGTQGCMLDPYED